MSAGPPPVEFFRTARLRFRPFAAGDLDDLFRLASDPAVIRYVGDGRPLDRATTSLWIDRSRENVARHGYGTGALTLLEADRLIGWAGFARPEGEPEELVYALDPALWGQGLGREALDGVVAYGFGRLGLTEVRAQTHPENLVSQHMLRRAGFEEQPPPDEDVRLFVLRRPF